MTQELRIFFFSTAANEQMYKPRHAMDQLQFSPTLTSTRPMYIISERCLWLWHRYGLLNRMISRRANLRKINSREVTRSCSTVKQSQTVTQENIPLYIENIVGLLESYTWIYVCSDNTGCESVQGMGLATLLVRPHLIEQHFVLSLQTRADWLSATFSLITILMRDCLPMRFGARSGP